MAASQVTDTDVLRMTEDDETTGEDQEGTIYLLRGTVGEDQEGKDEIRQVFRAEVDARGV